MRTFSIKKPQSPTLQFAYGEIFTVCDGQGRLVETWRITRSTYKEEGRAYFHADITEHRGAP